MASNESTLPSGTPKDDAPKDKKGIHDGPQKPVVAEEYPERPYKDAVTPEHLAVLKKAGQEPK